MVNKIFSRTKPDDEVRVQLKGGQTLSFDELVVTCPLGWLKRNLTAFDPPLPPVLTKAIGSIGYGSLEKVSCLVLGPRPLLLLCDGECQTKTKQRRDR